MRGKVGVLKAPPPADVEHKDQMEIVTRAHPLHHLVEGGATLGVQAALAAVRKLVDDLDIVLGREAAHVVLLDFDRVFLPDFRRVAVIRDGA